jgi:transposase
MKNKYLYRSHISEKKFRQILKFFCKDYTAFAVSDITGISRVTINKLYAIFRKRILKISDQRLLDTEVEIDESYFGARRVRGKRGRGAKGKTPIVGLLKRKGKVYTQVIPNCSRSELMPIIKGRILTDTTIYTDGWKSYDGLVLNGYKHYRIHHHKNEFARGKNHVNGIESFWSYTKRRLNKFNGIQKSKFILHLKESEYRWNIRTNNGNMYQELLKNFRGKPL